MRTKLAHPVSDSMGSTLRIRDVINVIENLESSIPGICRPMNEALHVDQDTERKICWINYEFKDPSFVPPGRGNGLRQNWSLPGLQTRLYSHFSRPARSEFSTSRHWAVISFLFCLWYYELRQVL